MIYPLVCGLYCLIFYDISNYVMLETGQPLHFYDADTLKGCLEVRMAKNGEKLTTLDNIERTLKAEDIVISDGERSIGLAGVMGGADTEVDAMFDMGEETMKLPLEEKMKYEQGDGGNNFGYVARELVTHIF